MPLLCFALFESLATGILAYTPSKQGSDTQKQEREQNEEHKQEQEKEEDQEEEQEQEQEETDTGMPEYFWFNPYSLTNRPDLM
jgi:flagellar biosynthesis component FlhA